MNNGTGAASLIILLVISGYILAVGCYAFRYRTARESGHRLYLTAASLGFASFILSAVILYLIHFLCVLLSNLPWVELSTGFLTPENTMAFIGTFSPILSGLIAVLYNRIPGKKAKHLYQAWEGDDLSALLCYSTREFKPIAVTTISRKIYIGYVARTNEPGEFSHITLLPLYSGYRDKDTLHLHITTEYTKVFDYYDPEKNNSTDIEDFMVVIPVSQIVSSHVFSADVYEKVNSHQKKNGDKGLQAD